MHRVLKHPRRMGWERLLATRLREIASILEEFRERDLAEVKGKELDGLARDIKACYSAFREVLGATSAGKAIHILAPKFFPLWDTRTRRFFGIKRTDAASYFRFMQKIREAWFLDKNLRKSLEKLEKELGISKLRIIDVYCWWKSGESRL